MKVLYFRKRHGRVSAGVYKVILLLATIPRLVLGLFPRWRSLAGNYWRLVWELKRM
ncbi:MAG: hypothetical protein KKD28_09915 [Chloroflexi bacterium]|nr:hypothetical protein [Chloroflexota bacterium]MBU1661775.1 hypothetical protein [Chloroflexota bacterium]